MTTTATPTPTTINLGRLRAHVQRSRAEALKAMGAADKVGSPAMHQHLAMVVSALDDSFEAIHVSHYSGQPIEMPERVDAGETLRQLLYSIEQATHGHSDPRAMALVRMAADRAKAEVGR